MVAGDSCRSIAFRVLGSAQALFDLHRLNPQLGPTPHALAAGQQLLIPRKKAAPPDANLTAARGDVAVRRPAQSVWDVAQRGMDLYRAWRVGARAKASAEVTFRDSSQLRLRENTVVIIYGPAVPRQTVNAVRAEIEGGSLEARLTAASGGANVAATTVLTPSSLAILTAGSSLFSVDAAGTSLIANHEGEPVAVRAVAKKQARGEAVRVASGMGSRVEVGKLPEPPRPLPAAPAFSQPQLTVPTFAASSSVKIAWQPVATAVRYRAVVLDLEGVEQNAILIPPGETSFELAAVPPGKLRVQLSSIDSAGFEGAPAALDVHVVTVAMTPPGTPALTGAPPRTPPPTTTGEAPLVVSLGARLASPDGLTCILDPEPAAPAQAQAQAPRPADAFARAPGRYRARCTPSDATGAGPAGLASLVEVVPVTASITSPITAPITREYPTELTIDVASSAPLGTNLTARASAGLFIQAQRWEGNRVFLTVSPAPSATATETITLAAADVDLTSLSLDIAAPPPPAIIARPTWSLELGGFAGLLLPPSDSSFGSPTQPRDQLASGPLLGARISLRSLHRPYLAARLDLAAATLSQVGTPDAPTLLAPSLALAARPLALGPLELWAFTGPSLATLLSAPNTLRTTTSLSLDLGAGLLLRNSGLAFRLDATWSLLDPTDLAEPWPSIRLGISTTIDR